LHDIGKVGVPDCILRKPSRLEIDEFDIMKQHTLIGAEALRAAAQQSIYGEFLLMAAEIARSHHEWFDGTGYPDGLAGSDIPLSARIVAVADVFDALTSRRVYKDAQAAHDAREAILAASGEHFDPHVVAAFERRYEDFLRVKNDNISFNMTENDFCGA
jgi:putative two-component system response regulator